MRPRFMIALVAIVLLAVGFSGGVLVGTNASRPAIDNLNNLRSVLTPSPRPADWQVLADVWSTVHRSYVNQNIDDQALVRGAVRGVVESLNDPYSVYFTPSEASSFQDEVEGVFQGVGMEVGYKQNQVTVIAPLPDSPAARAGIVSGDVVISIDGVETTTLTLDQAVAKIRGPKGTRVTLVVRGPNSSQNRTVTITRQSIKVDPVKSKTVSSNHQQVMIVTISSFTKDTGRLVQNAVRQALTSSVKGIILDLRNDPGGYLDQSISVASVFLDRGVVVSEVGRDGKHRDESVVGQALWPSQPLAVLVDGGTASAAEIVAGALQDHHRATLIGQTTFGKGSVQDYQSLADGSSLKLTVAKWYTPNGRSISEHGITPDQTVAMPSDDAATNRDPQLDAAEQAITTTP